MYIDINNWSGGISDSDIVGVKGSFAEGVGLDIHSKPNLLTVNQALAKNSGTTVTDFCKFAIYGSDGSSYWFGGTGKIYKRTSAGVWSNVYTDGSNRAILGALEYDGYIYWATATNLHRKPLPGNSDWSDAVANWQTLDSATYHQMTQQGLYLIICNARKVATVSDTGTFTADGTPDVTLSELPHNYELTTAINYGIDVLFGSKATDSYTKARLFRWDVASPSFISDDEVPEQGINCFIPADNYMFVQAGSEGRVYYYDGTQLTLRKRIKGDYSNKTMTIHPSSYTNFRGLSMFGVSNLSSNPCLEGVWSLGRYDNNYPLALNMEYVISQNKTSSIEIGAILTIGTNIFVAWKDSTTYGVDKIDWDNKYTGAYIKTLIIQGDRYANKDFTRHLISYNDLPTSTAITAQQSLNGATLTSLTLQENTTDDKYLSDERLNGSTIQYKVSFTTNSNDAPIIDGMHFRWDEKEKL